MRYPESLNSQRQKAAGCLPEAAGRGSRELVLNEHQVSVYNHLHFSLKGAWGEWRRSGRAAEAGGRRSGLWTEDITRIS